MKILITLLVAAGILSGCVGYIVPENQDNGRARHGDHDRDNDGIPNRADHDRDGDGVRNRQDSRPDNPNRN